MDILRIFAEAPFPACMPTAHVAHVARHLFRQPIKASGRRLNLLIKRKRQNMFKMIDGFKTVIQRR